MLARSVWRLLGRAGPAAAPAAPQAVPQTPAPPQPLAETSISEAINELESDVVAAMRRLNDGLDQAEHCSERSEVRSREIRGGMAELREAAVQASDNSAALATATLQVSEAAERVGAAMSGARDMLDNAAERAAEAVRSVRPAVSGLPRSTRWSSAHSRYFDRTNAWRKIATAAAATQPTAAVKYFRARRSLSAGGPGCRFSSVATPHGVRRHAPRANQYDARTLMRPRTASIHCWFQTRTHTARTLDAPQSAARNTNTTQARRGCRPLSGVMVPSSGTRRTLPDDQRRVHRGNG